MHEILYETNESNESVMVDMSALKDKSKIDYRFII